MDSPGQKVIQKWLQQKKWKLADFQKQTLIAFVEGKSGLLNAPTGSGKTYAMFIPVLVDYINNNKDYKKKRASQLYVVWITPLRALTKDIQRNLQLACDEMEIPWQVGVRTGDMSAKDKTAQKKAMPQVLLITPESLHLLFATKDNAEVFRHLKLIVVDEWHELLSTKRGVQTELALARLRNIQPDVLTWGISATIGNLEQAKNVLLGVNFKRKLLSEIQLSENAPLSCGEGQGDKADKSIIITSTLKKKIIVESVLPDKIESLPWAGYLGTNLLDKIMPIVLNSKSTLLFINVRSQTEIWYRFILEKYPELAGQMAIHHGSLDREIRNWVEDALHNEKLKLVVCTSSLDLGVDFRPVETVIQVGSPKSVSRFLQRAGRSGHRPGETSKIYFVPTHALELIEAVSLRVGVERNIIEDRLPVVNAYDVLAQYMVTLAVGDGFEEEKLFNEIKSTFAYQYITRNEWEWLLGFITTGGATLIAYDEFRKVERDGNLFIVKDKRIAMRHRLSMGTIVSDAAISVKFLSGKYIGTIEESFISRLKPGDVFSFGGMNLEFIRVREMIAQVRKSSKTKGTVPSWQGSRIALSSQLSEFIRERLDGILNPNATEPEIKKLQPLLQLQHDHSAIPTHHQLLIEQCETKEGHHIFIFPFEGRLVHEGLSAVIAYRISKITPISFSIAMSDYGFELLSDTYINLSDVLEEHNLFTTENLLDDIQHSVNSIEMAKRKFREIASIAGLIFTGYPGKSMKTKHIQASSSLLFEVIREHEPNNLLIRQAYQESLDQQLEEHRMRKALQRIAQQQIIIKYPERPTPFAFPILVDRFREQLTSEKIEDRIQKLIKQIDK